MVGAGFSLNAIAMETSRSRMPDWRGLAVELGRALVADEANRKKLFEDAGTVAEGYMRLAQYFEAKFGRPALDQFILASISDALYQPGPLHARLLSLPWRAVFTTNWDTLLERAAIELAEPVYFPVARPDQLMTAGHPRIVKLHGCVEKAHHFVFTEEDYRRYPHSHSTFVTVVRNALLEGPLCLVGFSGEDPNFRQWVGWVRDNTPEQHPLYLVHVSEQPMADFQIDRLRTQGVTVLQVGSSGVPPADTLESLLNFFKHGSDRTWPDVLDKLGIDDGAPQQISKALATIVDAYPGWLVCPTQYREKLASKLLHHDACTAANLPLMERLDYLAFRAMAMSWLGISVAADDAPLVDTTLAEYVATLGAAPPAENAISLGFARLSQAIHDLEIDAIDATFDCLGTLVANASAAHQDRLILERAIFTFRRLDREGASFLLANFASTDPLLQLRALALRLELHADEAALAAARELARKTTHLVRQFPYSERHASLEDAVSRMREQERRAHKLASGRRTSPQEGIPIDDAIDLRSARRRALECDVSIELRYISAVVRQPAHAPALGKQCRQAFGSGSFTTSVILNKELPSALRYSYQMARLPDSVGLMVCCHQVGLLTEPLQAAASWLELFDEPAALSVILRLVATGRTDSVKLLTRSTIARLPLSVATGVWPWLIAALEKGLRSDAWQPRHPDHALVEGCLDLARKLVIRLDARAGTSLLELTFKYALLLPAGGPSEMQSKLAEAVSETYNVVGSDAYAIALLDAARRALTDTGATSALGSVLSACKGYQARKDRQAGDLIDLCITSLQDSNQIVRWNAIHVVELLDALGCVRANDAVRIGEVVWTQDAWPNFGSNIEQHYLARWPGKRPERVRNVILAGVTSHSRPSDIIQAASLLAALNRVLSNRGQDGFSLNDEMQQALVESLEKLSERKPPAVRLFGVTKAEQAWEDAYSDLVATDPRHPGESAALLERAVSYGLISLVGLVRLQRAGVASRTLLLERLTLPISDDANQEWDVLLALMQAIQTPHLDDETRGRLFDEVSVRLRYPVGNLVAQALGIAVALVQDSVIEIPLRVSDVWLHSAAALAMTEYNDTREEVRYAAPTIRVSAGRLLVGLIARVSRYTEQSDVQTALDALRKDPLPEVRAAVASN